MPYDSLVKYFSQPFLLVKEVQRLTIHNLAKLNGFAFFPFASCPIETKDFSQWWSTILHTFYLAPSSSYLVKLIDEESSQSKEKRPKKASSPARAQQEKKGKAFGSHKAFGSIFYCIILIVALPL